MNTEILKKLHEMKPDDRRDFLEANAAKTLPPQSYLKPMTEGELRQAQEDLATISIDKAVLEDELAKIKEEYKLKLKPLASQFSQKLLSIKMKAHEKNGPVHLIPDYDNFYMHTIADDGTYINGRMMLPEERQMTITGKQLSANE